MIEERKSSYLNYWKPVLEGSLALIALPFLLPIFVFIGVVNFCLGLPVFYFHQRPGKGEKLFYLIKFCTINPKSKAIGAFSQFLRKSSLDELPQLLNVLRGQMSLIGPRPLLIEYLEKYTPTQAQRHAVKPGVTGLAQVSGRNELSFEDKINYDLKYVDTVSFLVDFRIFLRTAVQVFKYREADGHQDVADKVKSKQSLQF